MRAFLLAAGQGLRLRPLTITKPKALVPIANRPAIVRLLEFLQPYRFKETFINQHFMPENVRDVVGSGRLWNANVHYSFESELLGTAGAVKKLEKFLDDDKFLIINADIVTNISLDTPIEFHETRGAEATLIMTSPESDHRKEQIGVCDDGRILLEKNPEDIVNSGTYTGIGIFEPSVLKMIPQGYSSLLDSVLIPLAEEGSLYAYFADGYWLDIGTPKRYIQANKDLISGKMHVQIDGRLVGENIWIDETSEIDLTVRVEEPALIGKGVSIDRGAVIGPYAIIGDGCQIGPKVEISNSVVWDGSQIGSSCLIDSSIIASNQRVTPGQQLKRAILHGGIAEQMFNVG